MYNFIDHTQQVANLTINGLGYSLVFYAQNSQHASDIQEQAEILNRFIHHLKQSHHQKTINDVLKKAQLLSISQPIETKLLTINKQLILLQAFGGMV